MAPAAPSTARPSSFMTTAPTTSVRPPSPSTPRGAIITTSSSPQHPSLAQLLLPLLPVLVLALLVLFLLRLLLRQCHRCLHLRLQFGHCSRAGGNAASASPPSRQTMHSTLESPENSQINEVAPWSNEPCLPLFLLQQQQPEFFFPLSGSAGFDPLAAFWLEQQALMYQMPPKYEDAIKMQLAHHQQQQQSLASPSMPPTAPPVQPLCIPSLQSRAAQMLLPNPSETSPPPCYEQASQMPQLLTRNMASMGIGRLEESEATTTFVPTTTVIGRQHRTNRHQELPPSYLSASADNLLQVCAAANEQHPRSCSSLPPPEDRPCSSCSLASFGSVHSAPEASHQPKSRVNTGTFVPKSAGSRQHRRDAREEE